MALDPFAIVDDKPNQISEALFGFSLDIKVDTHRRAWKLGRTKHIDRLVANGQSMQRVIAQLGWHFSALAVSPGPKRMRELGEREHSVAGVSLDIFFPYAPQETQIVLPDGLVTAAVAERADAAMIIQKQFGRGISALQTLGVSKEIFRKRQGWPESDARPCAIVPEIDDPATGKRPLNSPQKNRARGQLLAI